MSTPARRHDAGETPRPDGRLTPRPPTTSPASRVQRGPSPANAESGSIDRPRTPRRAPAGHLLPRAPRPNGDAGYCSERGTPPGTRGHAEDSHIISSRPPRFSGFVKPLQQPQLLRRPVLNSHMAVRLADELREPPSDERRSIVSHQKRPFRQWSADPLRFLACQLQRVHDLL